MEKRDSGASLCWRLLLLLLLLMLPPTHQGRPLRHTDPIQSAQDSPAKYLSNGPGQEPVTVMTIDLTEISKPHSSFEFRTWDPEGVIFYGDTNTEDDWFLLGLRAGQLEIQLHNAWARLTVGFGPRLDDGRWHPLMPAMDGCIRQDIWLDHQAQLSASARLGNCDVDLQPGLFFPPGTHAEFSLQDIPQPHADPWTFSLELGFKLVDGSGRLLALGTGTNSSWLNLHLQNQSVVLSSEAKPKVVLPLDMGLLLQLTLDRVKVALSQGPKTEVLSMSLLRPASLWTLWSHPQGHLSLGPLPGERSSASFCLSDLWVQGQRLDIDQALSRSQDIWTHSCPQRPSNDTRTSH
ncbi:sex hormone-binding globulin isoform X2 [Mus caroli]|uniref:Sex hormone-binding globulin n=1 Tax=Mus caroli TaxID=10089 RepID=A0A6P5QS25_MUSCR|nr:sex hormone-binding globulin isoform X2 [Mus caroli]